MTKDIALSRHAEKDRRCPFLVISVGNLREYIRQMLNTVVNSLVVVVVVAAAVVGSFALSVTRSVDFEIISMQRRWHHASSWLVGACWSTIPHTTYHTRCIDRWMGEEDLHKERG